jgi:hypothetical protein
MFQVLKISSYWLDGFFNLFSSMNRFICPISCISNQISHTLKVFYDDLRVFIYYDYLLTFLFKIIDIVRG